VPLQPCDVAERSSGGGKVSYIEGYRAFEIANDIFGPTDWSTSTKTFQVVIDKQTPDKKYSVGGFAIMNIMLKNGVSHSDVGWGSNIGKTRADAYDTAIKGVSIL